MGWYPIPVVFCAAMTPSERMHKRNLIAQWAFDTSPILGRFHLWLEDVDVRIERNDDAIDAPEAINASPFDQAWLVRVRVGDPAQLDALMDAEAYDAFATSAAH